MAYVKSKKVAKITESDKILKDKAFEIIASNPKHNGYKRRFSFNGLQVFL